MKIVALVVCLFIAPVAFAQSNLLRWDGPPGSVEHPNPGIRGAEREWPVGINMREIMANDRARSKVRVIVPGHPPLVFSAIDIEPTSGFRIVRDFEYEPDPNVPDSGLTYTWFGNAGSRQMTIAVHKGRMSATIQFDDRVYSISSRNGQPVIRQFDPELMLGDADEGLPTGGTMSATALVGDKLLMLAQN